MSLAGVSAGGIFGRGRARPRRSFRVSVRDTREHSRSRKPIWDPARAVKRGGHSRSPARTPVPAVLPFAAVLLFVLAALLSGCTGDDAGRNAAAGEPAGAVSGALAGGAPADTAARTVTIYSSHPDELIKLVVREFQERTGLRVHTVKAGTGALLQRLAADGAASECDVFWGGGAESLEAVKTLFEPYRPVEMPDLPGCRDPEGYWTGFSLLPMVIMYNTKLVRPEDAPTSWKDLADPRWRGRIASADPAVSGSAFTIVSTVIAAGTEDGVTDRATVASILANLTVVSGSEAVYSGVAEGEFALGLTFEEPAARFASIGADVGIVYPADGTSAVPDGIALVSGAKNPDGAKRFIEFVLGRDVQTILSRVFLRRPVRSDIDPPPGLVPFEELPLLPYDVKLTASRRNEVLALFRTAVGRSE